MKRVLSRSFMKSLVGEDGILHPLAEMVRKDDTLDFHIRHNKAHVYYRGGKILDITHLKNSRGFKIFMDGKYAKGGGAVPAPGLVETPDDMASWLQALPSMKTAIDLFSGTITSMAEREFQQLLVRENTYSNVSNLTDYFIVDIEYQTRLPNGKDTKFDLVGFRWESTPTARKLAGGYAPRIALFEMKYGDGALTGKAGLLDHFDKTLRFLETPQAIESLKAEMITVFKQKRELGFVRFSKKGNPNDIFEISTRKPQFILVIANHDPARKQLMTVIDSKTFKEAHQALSEHADIRFARAGYLGYGLFQERMMTYEEFREILD